MVKCRQKPYLTKKRPVLVYFVRIFVRYDTSDHLRLFGDIIQNCSFQKIVKIDYEVDIVGGRNSCIIVLLTTPIGCD